MFPGPMPLTRRTLLSRLAGAAAGAGVSAIWPGRTAFALGPGSQFRVARLVLPGLEDDPRPGAWARLVWEVLKRTSIDADMESPALLPGSAALFDNPFLVLAAEQGFPDPPDATVEVLRRHLTGGGMLLADSCGSRPDGAFDRSFRALMARCLPDNPLQRLDRQHTVFRSFYLLDQPHGRVRVKPYLEGATQDDRALVIYSQNDLPGAWARDAFGGWRHEMASGGEREREMAFRLGVNIVMYALTLNYKRDQVHVRHILKKLRRQGADDPGAPFLPAPP